jgi:hypothetical protein
MLFNAGTMARYHVTLLSLSLARHCMSYPSRTISQLEQEAVYQDDFLSALSHMKSSMKRSIPLDLRPGNQNPTIIVVQDCMHVFLFANQQFFFGSSYKPIELSCVP